MKSRHVEGHGHNFDGFTRQRHRPDGRRLHDGHFGEAAASCAEGYMRGRFADRGDCRAGHAFGSAETAPARPVCGGSARHPAGITAVSASDLRQPSARCSGSWPSQRFVVSIEDRKGRRSTDGDAGVPAGDVEVLDPLGRLRPKRSAGRRIRSVDQLHRHRRRLAAADAEARDALPAAVRFQRAEQGGEDAGAARRRSGGPRRWRRHGR